MNKKQLEDKIEELSFLIERSFNDNEVENSKHLLIIYQNKYKELTGEVYDLGDRTNE